METLVNPLALPSDMRALSQWLIWRYEGTNGKRTKRPYQLNGQLAKVNDATTWTSFDSAISESHADGIGFVFNPGDGFVGIDLDNCFDDDGNTADWAMEIIELFSGNYMELSPSGKGLHIICKGKAIRCAAKKWTENGVKVGVEIYDGSSPRYFTMTGNVFGAPGVPQDSGDALINLHDIYFPEKQKHVAPVGAHSQSVDVPRVVSALKAIPSEDYDEWLRVGMALKSANLPFQLFNEWSSTSSNYNPEVALIKWDSYKKDEGVGLGTLFYLAIQYGWKTPIYSPQIDIHQLERETNNSDPESEQTESKPKSIFADNVADMLNQAEHHRWKGQYIPPGYQLTNAGVIKLNDKNAGELICGPLFVVAQTETPEGKNGGLVLELETLNGVLRVVALPRGTLHDHNNTIATDLASLNFFIKVGKEKDMLTYLGLSRAKEKRIAATQTGWAQADDPDKLVFVLPNTATEPGYHFQPEKFNRSSESVTTRGTLDDWIDNVFDPSPYPLFSVLFALSCPLLRFAGMNSGGVNFWGSSSSGKTTLAQIAASVYGNGTDPSNAAAKSYINRWNTTINALEGLATAFNDLLLILDELGSSQSKDYGRALYDLSGGQGKSAMDASRRMRDTRSWCVGILSTGEVTSRSKIEEGLIGKKAQAKAGQLIRLIDLEIKANMFSGRSHVDKLKRACSLYYGTLGQAYLEAIVRRYTAPELRNIVTDNLDFALNRLMAQRGKISAIQERALRWFAIAETAGHLIVTLKLIPELTNQMVREAIDQVVNDWAPSSRGLTDDERSVVSLREFILKNRDIRFKKLSELPGSDKIHREIAGYYDSARDAFFFLPEAFREATGGEPRITAAVLRERGYLVTYQSNRLVYRVNVEGNQIYGYCVSAKLLEGDTND